MSQQQTEDVEGVACCGCLATLSWFAVMIISIGVSLNYYDCNELKINTSPPSNAEINALFWCSITGLILLCICGCIAIKDEKIEPLYVVSLMGTVCSSLLIHIYVYIKDLNDNVNSSNSCNSNDIDTAYKWCLAGLICSCIYLGSICCAICIFSNIQQSQQQQTGVVQDYRQQLMQNTSYNQYYPSLAFNDMNTQKMKEQMMITLLNTAKQQYSHLGRVPFINRTKRTLDAMSRDKCNPEMISIMNNLIEKELKEMTQQIDKLHLNDMYQEKEEQKDVDDIKINIDTKNDDIKDITKQWDKIKTGDFTERVRLISEIYDKWCTARNNETGFSHVSIRDIIDSLDGYSITLLWNEFAKLRTNPMDSKEKYNYFGTCQLKECQKHYRNNRDRNKYGDIAKRKQLYFGYCQSKETVGLQICDSIHDFIYHSILDTVNITDTNQNTKQFSNNHLQKFTTSILPKQEDTKHDDESTLPKFSVGVQFSYWERQRIGGSEIQKPIYKNLKEELLSNKIYAVTINDWNDEYNKAIIRKNSVCKDWAANNCGVLNDNLDIPFSLPMSIAHILSILFYLHFDELQCQFKKKGCRRLYENEQILNVAKRNNQIGHWYTLFKECIVFYSSQTTQNDTFYHGLGANKFLFEEFVPDFQCPISTTTSMIVVQRFAVQGIVLTLQPLASLKCSYLNVTTLSEYNEEERIFEHAPGLTIVDIRESDTILISNMKFIKALVFLETVISGHYFDMNDINIQQYQQLLIEMIQNKMNVNDVTNIAPYVAQLFDYFTSKRKQIHLIKSQYLLLSEKLKPYLWRVQEENINNIWNKDIEINIAKEFSWNIKDAMFDKLSVLPELEVMYSDPLMVDKGITLKLGLQTFRGFYNIFINVTDLPLIGKNEIIMQIDLLCKQINFKLSQKMVLLKGDELGVRLCSLDKINNINQLNIDIAISRAISTK